MSVTVGRGKLKNATIDLMAQWEETKAAWRDVRANEIERKFLNELEPQIRAALAAMDRIGAQITQAKHECS